MGETVDHSLAQSSPRTVPRWLTPALVSIAASVIFSAPLRRSSIPEMTWFQDDLFYYLKTAANLADGHGSTFDGIHRTNGYHPLYFLLTALFSRIDPAFHVLTICLSVLAVLASTTSFLAIRAILCRCVSLQAVILDALAVLVLIPCLNTFYLGMETTLTLPLGLILLAFWVRTLSHPDPRTAALCGLLAGLVVLSRLDACFLVALLLLFTWFFCRQITLLTRASTIAFTVCFATSLLPYFLLNKVNFGVWLPVSGLAKQLRWHHAPSAEAWRSVLHPTPSQAFLLLLSISAIPLFVGFSSRLQPGARAVIAAAISFRWLQFAMLSLVSDWPLWGWYFYSVRFAVLAACVLVAAALTYTRLALRSTAACNLLLVSALVLLFAQHWKRDPGSENIYRTAVSIAAFTTSHPGLLAMGDRAGMVGYLARSPLLQTEGLVMDGPFLDHIRRQDDLLTTLRSYGVRFYVTSLANPVHNGSCLLAEEPALAGPDSPRMRSRLCSRPVLTLAGEHTTFVFDLASEP